jgi:hypothetical protein
MPDLTPGPCPWCGSDQVSLHEGGGQWITCICWTCEARGPLLKYPHTRDEARDAWNRLSQLSEVNRELVEALELYTQNTAIYVGRSQQAYARRGERADKATAALARAKGES